MKSAPNRPLRISARSGNIFGAYQPADGFTESLVYFSVGLPESVLVQCIGKEIVAQRPDGTVAVTFVIIFYLGVGQEYGVKV